MEDQEKHRQQYLTEAREMYKKGGWEVQHTDACNKVTGQYPSAWAIPDNCICWPLITKHVPTSSTHLPAGVRPLPSCPYIDDHKQHPVFDEITERDRGSFEASPLGGYREKQIWLVYTANISTYRVVGYHDQEGLVATDDDDEQDYAIDLAPDYQMSYTLGDTGMEILICGTCRAEFSWEEGIGNLRQLKHGSGRWE